jgi:hypothetical protein
MNDPTKRIGRGPRSENLREASMRFAANAHGRRWPVTSLVAMRRFGSDRSKMTHHCRSARKILAVHKRKTDLHRGDEVAYPAGKVTGARLVQRVPPLSSFVDSDSAAQSIKPTRL